MIDQTLLNSNFIGRDGFRWWIGQVPPIESNGKQSNGGGWGNRCKVRIMGYHPDNPVELSNDDLPWAQVLLPTTSGSGASNYAVTQKIRPGDTVFGFFLDGDNGQLPVIMGCFGRTEAVSSKQYSAPFTPFTGYTNNIDKPNGQLYPSESNEQNAKSQKSPRDVPSSITSKLNNTKKGKDEITSYTGIGKKIVFANSCDDTAVKGIISEVTNLLDKFESGLNKVANFTNEINRSVEKIVGIANNIVGQMFNSLFNKLIPILQKGLDLLYKKVYAAVLAATGSPIAAHLAGVAAQTAMVPPVKLLEKAIPCVAATVVNGLSKMVKDLLKSVLNNVKKFVTCAGTQFAGAFINGIIDKIRSGLSGVLGGVSKILTAGFNIIDILRGGVNIIKSIGGLFDCNQSKTKCQGLIKEWTIGCGPKGSNNEKSLFKDIVGELNATKSNLKNLDFDVFNEKKKKTKKNKSLKDCYVGYPTSCEPPKVTIFGGGGEGASASAILGSFAKNEIVDPILGGGITASVIGIKVNKKGSGYRYPPFVEIEDNCNQGYGAIARTTINENGEIEDIYMVSVGENYPIGNIDPSSSISTADFTDSAVYGVVKVTVVESGSGYSAGDYAVDNYGNRYTLNIDEDYGFIVSSDLEYGISITESDTDNTNIIRRIPTINTNVITSDSLPPEMRIISETGSGAILKPIIGEISTSIEEESLIGDLKVIVDCVE